MRQAPPSAHTRAVSDAEILELLNGERAAYRVRWSAGRESILYPGSDVFVEHYPRRGRGRT